MYNKTMYEIGVKNSVIRELFEYGKKRAIIVGKKNVFDYSIGNPSVPPPEIVKNSIIELLNSMNSMDVHGYTSASGNDFVRQSISDFLNKTYGTNFNLNNFYMTCGAASSLSITFSALSEKDDEIIFFAPFFPEYTIFAKNAGLKPVIVLCDKNTLQIDLKSFENAISEKTKAIVVNSPNNPSGVVISEEKIKLMVKILEKKSKEYQHPIFLISDEPYREIVYDNIKVPYLTKYYKNTIVCYSFSKSLSLPGERIGYILVPDEVEESKNIFKSICGAGRSLGYVCAPSLMQLVISKCIGYTSDISIYKKNRDLLIKIFNECGFKFIKPDGAFYIFLKSPDIDANIFVKKARKYELLLVPSDSFGFPGYVRVASCVSTEMIERSIPSFKKLAGEYK